ncbi:hypothetical protein DFQ27_003109 [Actinomortierella ambigua]|uniref:Chloride channel protein n=1 Tax=Actinomortierella ambigua TaxID=1343610 RepID=A0A9P6Q7T0_9FUNG|nr:hypothetical protein DFQ27_003109 [Actinomortierella ambigua]
MSHSPDGSISPSNQPRRSLSTNLQPDYHDWVTNATTSTFPSTSAAAAAAAATTQSGQHSEPASSRQSLYPAHGGASSYSGSTAFSPAHQHQPPSTSSTHHSLLDAVAQRILPSSSASSTQQRRPRPNQPSFAGSVSTDGANDDDNDDPDPRADLVHGRDNNDNDGSSHNTEPPRLPSLSESQVPVRDPYRPAYKLGRPNSRPRRATQNEFSTPRPSLRRPDTQQQPQRQDQQADEYSESSALLGSAPDGSRRRIPTYTQRQEDRRLHHTTHDEQDNDDDDADEEEREEDDDFDTRSGTSDTVGLLRRPSRARSMSPTLEMRRAGMGGGRSGLSFRDSDRVNRRRHSPTGRSYSRGGGGGGGGGRGDKRSLAFHRLRRSSLANIKDFKTKLLSRRKTVYDDAKEALVRENNGIRVWYHNYTTIDWIHDFVKERVRLRQIRAYPGCRGRIINWADSLKGWVLVLLTAGGSEISEWDTAKPIFGGANTFAAGKMILLFATVCVVMVTSDGTVSIQRSHGATKGRPGMSQSNSKSSLESTIFAAQPKKIAYFGAGSGIPEVKTILGGFVIRGFLGFRTLMIKLIGMPLMVASGLNMGKQGPLVHIACCVANIVCRIFDKYNRNDGKRREILSAAAASGVAVAFGAPIGGVLFSLEEVSYYFPSKTMWRSYFCALISAVVLKGAYGAIFSQFHMSYTRFRSRTWIGRHPVQEVMIVTIITCAVQWLNPWTRVQVDQIYPIFLLLAEVFVMKVVLNFITFGVKVPGGIFVPTMVAGAVFGRMVGIFVQWLIVKYPEHQLFQSCEGESMDCVIPGLYAMIGAAACLAGVTRMTVSLVVIMFELTGAMTYALPIMMAVMIGKFVGDAFSPDAFFNKLIALNEHPYLDSKKDYNTFGTAADIADRFLETIEVNEVNTVETLRRKLEVLIMSGYSDGGLPIVDNGVLVGYIASNELAHALDLAEQKHPDCVCIFRNRASSEYPVSEIVLPTVLQADLEQQRRELQDARSPLFSMTMTLSPDRVQSPQQRQQHEYRGDQRPGDRGRAGFFIPDDDGSSTSSSSSSVSSLRHQLGAGHEYYATTDAGYVPKGRIDSMATNATAGTTALIEHPGLTMDFTPFTDQAPLAVSKFSSMDLVVELFIKLGIKYVCVVKAGEHYGMIHKKQLLTFLKENDEMQRRYDRQC